MFLPGDKLTRPFPPIPSNKPQPQVNVIKIFQKIK
jgi:hypothetical protein